MKQQKNQNLFGLKAGTSTVTITLELTGGIKYTDTCTVTVSE